MKKVTIAHYCNHYCDYKGEHTLLLSPWSSRKNWPNRIITRICRCIEMPTGQNSGFSRDGHIHCCASRNVSLSRALATLLVIHTQSKCHQMWWTFTRKTINLMIFHGNIGQFNVIGFNLRAPYLAITCLSFTHYRTNADLCFHHRRTHAACNRFELTIRFISNVATIAQNATSEAIWYVLHKLHACFFFL